MKLKINRNGIYIVAVKSSDTEEIYIRQFFGAEKDITKRIFDIVQTDLCFAIEEEQIENSMKGSHRHEISGCLSFDGSEVSYTVMPLSSIKRCHI